MDLSSPLSGPNRSRSLTSYRACIILVQKSRLVSHPRNVKSSPWTTQRTFLTGWWNTHGDDLPWINPLAIRWFDELAMKELPSASIEKWLAAVRESANEAAIAVAAAASGQQTGEGGEGGVLLFTALQ